MSTLDEMLESFASLTGDAVGVGFRAPGDYEARMIWVNNAYQRMFGYSQDEVLGRFVSFTNDPDHHDQFIEQVKPQFETGKTEIYGETWCRTKDGRRLWTSLALFVRNGDGGRYSAAIYRDLTWLKEREIAAEEALKERDDALRRSEETQSRLMCAINAVPDPLAIWDRNFRLVVANDAFAPRLLGRSEPVLPGSSVEEVLREASRSGQLVDAIDRAGEWAAESIAALRSGPIRDITRYTDGSVFKAVSHLAPNGDTLVLTTNITELEHERLVRESFALRLEEARDIARHQALHDELTGLANRRRLSEALSELTARKRTQGGELVAIQIDLDRFKQINDTRGHAVGDHVLAEATRRIKSLVSPDDLVARIGGDEFVILRLLPDPDVTPARLLAEEVVRSLLQPFQHEGQELRIGASAGVASTLLSSEEDILTDADIALYKAKGLGRGRVCTFEVADYEAMEMHKRLSDEIIRALEDDQFVPFAQPQVCAFTQTIVGFEILARWQHPSRGIITPDVFLPVAKDLALAESIDRQIFARSFETFSAAFPALPAPTLSFNVSNRRLMSRGILDDAQRAARYPGGVAFELLESILLDDRDHASFQQLDALRDIGIQIYIDDFGSGHASIIGLGQVSPDRIKIDRRLIAPVAVSERSRKMVHSIAELAAALEIDVTAEGVETVAQAAILRDLGCQTLQGFLFGRPAPVGDMISAYKAGTSAASRLA